MEVRFNSLNKNLAPMYILWVLENYSDEKTPITRREIQRILSKKGFDIERKALTRNLKLLVDFGYDIPGATEPLDENGYEIEGKSVNKKIYLKKELDDSKLRLLIDAVLFSKHIPKSMGKELIERLLEMGSETLRKKDKSVARINTLSHTETGEFLSVIKDIQQAIIDGKKVRMLYANNDNIATKKPNYIVVSPYYLVLSYGYYYMIGENSETKEIKNYRLDKIPFLTIEKDNATPIKETELRGRSLGEYLKAHPFMKSGKTERIVMRVKGDTIEQLTDYFSDIRVIKKEYSDIIVEVNTSKKDVVVFLKLAGRDAEVLKPRDLRQKIKGMYKDLSLTYINDFDEGILEENQMLTDSELTAMWNKYDQEMLRLKPLRDGNVSVAETMKNFFHDEELSFNSLVKLVKDKIAQEKIKLTDREKNRIESELDMIYEKGIAPLIMFYYGIVNELRKTSYVHIIGTLNVIYICYILNITSVNPLIKGIESQCVLSGAVESLPTCRIVVSNGIKSRVINYIQEKYGRKKIARVGDNSYYVVANRDINEYFAMTSPCLHTESKDDIVWKEQVTAEKVTSINKRNLVTFEVVEDGRLTRTDSNRVWEYISDNPPVEEDIYYYAENRYLNFEEETAYRGEREIANIFCETNNMFIYYDEQYYKFCNKILGIDNNKAEDLRHKLNLRNKDGLKYLSSKLNYLYGEEGNKITNFIAGNITKAVSKGYVSSEIMLLYIINHFKPEYKNKFRERDIKEKEVKKYPNNLLCSLFGDDEIVLKDYKKTDNVIKAIMNERLNATQKFVIIRMYQDGLTKKEVAEEMGINEGIVEAITARAMRILRHPKSTSRIREFLNGE